MSRTRASAKAAGRSFETLMATYFHDTVDDRIERRRQGGSKDRGDISGLRHMGGRAVVECKDRARLDLAGWAAEAETERGNDDALVGVIAHKRHGNANPADQWITMTAGNFVALLNGNRDHMEEK